MNGVIFTGVGMLTAFLIGDSIKSVITEYHEVEKLRKELAELNAENAAANTAA